MHAKLLYDPTIPLLGIYPEETIIEKDICTPMFTEVLFTIARRYGCESWTKSIEEIDAFELWCWRRFLRVPWTARRSNQSVLKEINCGYSWEGLMLKLKLQYFGHLMQRTESLEKTLSWERLKAGGEGDDRMSFWMTSPTQWT